MRTQQQFAGKRFRLGAVACSFAGAVFLISFFASPRLSLAQPPVEFTTLVSFAGTNGAAPTCPLFEAPDGNFYGTTQGGGEFGRGTAFRVAPDGTLTTLASFNGTNGSESRAGLVLGPDGNFYGTTRTGGDFNLGTIFRLSPQGVITTLHSFDGTNGSGPMSELCVGKDGHLYGTAREGGRPLNMWVPTCGTIFRITLAGDFTTLIFMEPDRAQPWAPLVQANDGNFYGTTYYPPTCFFKVTPSGEFTRILVFDNTNACGSQFGVVIGRDGNFYNTSIVGTNRDHYGNTLGNVYCLTPTGEATNLFNFDGTNGATPRGLLHARDGNFYGVTANGGLAGYGTIFQVPPDGALRTLYNFTNAVPFCSLIEGSDGCLYGTSMSGGDYGIGSVFRVKVRMLPAFQSIEHLGNEVKLSWSTVSGLSYQVQNLENPAANTWSDLGLPITATNGVERFWDSATGESFRLYRIKLLP